MISKEELISRIENHHSPACTPEGWVEEIKKMVLPEVQEAKGAESKMRFFFVAYSFSAGHGNLTCGGTGSWPLERFQQLANERCPNPPAVVINFIETKDIEGTI